MLTDENVTSLKSMPVMISINVSLAIDVFIVLQVKY